MFVWQFVLTLMGTQMIVVDSLFVFKMLEAQMRYHQAAVHILKECLPVVEQQMGMYDLYIFTLS